MIQRVLAAMAAAAVMTLAGCASVGPNPLGPQARDDMFVRNVEVSWSPELAQRDAKHMSQKDFADVQPRLSAAVAAAFKNSPSGSKPVDFRIEVTKYYPGGLLDADVTVVTADGQVLGVYKRVEGIHAQSGGLVGALVEAALKTDYLGIIDNSFAQNLKARFNGT